MREVRIKLVSRDPIIDYPVSKPEDAVVLMQEIIGDMADEYFAAVFMNTMNKPLDFIIAGIGSVDRALIEPSTIIKSALLQNAPKAILFHNHPSGDLKPSAADIASTQRLVMAGKLNQIEILDHVVVTGNDYYSFAERGLLNVSDGEYLEGLKELKAMRLEDYNAKYAFRTGQYYDDPLCIQ